MQNVEIETTLSADIACSQSCAEDPDDDGTLVVVYGTDKINE